MRVKSRFLAGALACAGPVAMAGVAALGGAAHAQTMTPPQLRVIAALWTEHKMDFRYFGRTSRYSCAGLTDKLHAMLLDVGARRDLRIIALGCDPLSHAAGDDRRGGRDGAEARETGASLTLSLVFSVPMPRSADASDGGQNAVEASFEPFSFVQDSFGDFEVGDCELVEEFARQILPQLATRRLKQRIDCVPQLAAGGFMLKGQVLKAMPQSMPIAR